VSDPDAANYTAPVYFKEAFFAGKSLSATDAAKYGNIVPFVALYSVDYDKYYNDFPKG